MRLGVRVKRTVSCCHCCCGWNVSCREISLHAFFLPFCCSHCHVKSSLISFFSSRTLKSSSSMNRVLGKFIVEEFRIIHEFWWRSPVFVWRFPTKGEFQKKKTLFPLQMINREIEMKLTTWFPHVTFFLPVRLFNVSKSVDKSDKNWDL